MASGSPIDDSGSPDIKQAPPGPPSPPPANQAQAEFNGNEVHPAQSNQDPQGQQFFNAETTHDTTVAEPGGPLPVPFPAMPMFPYPAVGPMTRPKRTQCKNACTNCQRACKKCDDNRPCHRCIRYGTTDTCVDSKRKERKKGVKRGPYKKRDSKGNNADADNDDATGSANGPHGPSPNMPYVGPVGYPPGMWSSYSPGGPGAKIEGGGFYQPVFALTPVAGQGPHPGEGENTSAGSEAPPHFPVGFYPATFISYPGPYPPYPIPPPGQGSSPHGFHYAYPSPPGVVYPSRLHPMTASAANGESSTGAADSQTKDNPESGPNGNAPKGDSKNATIEPSMNGKAQLPESVNGAATKDHE